MLSVIPSNGYAKAANLTKQTVGTPSPMAEGQHLTGLPGATWHAMGTLQKPAVDQTDLMSMISTMQSQPYLQALPLLLLSALHPPVLPLPDGNPWDATTIPLVIERWRQKSIPFRELP